MKIIGLTGNMGSGKSSVSNILRSKGGYIIDADEIAHDILDEGKEAYKEIVSLYGERILEGKKIDRKKLSEIVFSSPGELEKLEKISHKYILQEIMTGMDEARLARDRYKFIVLDAPLLLETESHKIVDEVWVVYADKEIRIKRIIDRDKTPVENIEKRIKNQMPFEQQKEFADVLIENNKDFESLERLVLKKLGV